MVDRRRFPFSGLIIALAAACGTQQTPSRSEPSNQLAHQSAALPSSQSGNQVGDKCELSYEYPKGWGSADVITDDKEWCGVIYASATYEQIHAAGDTLREYVQVMRYPFALDSAARREGFVRRGDTWVVLGRQEFESPAQAIVGLGWRGVRGTALIGCKLLSDSTTTALCDSPRAVIADSLWAVVVSAGPKGEDAFELFLKTVKLPTRRPEP